VSPRVPRQQPEGHACLVRPATPLALQRVRAHDTRNRACRRHSKCCAMRHSDEGAAAGLRPGGA